MNLTVYRSEVKMLISACILNWLFKLSYPSPVDFITIEVEEMKTSFCYPLFTQLTPDTPAISLPTVRRFPSPAIDPPLMC